MSSIIEALNTELTDILFSSKFFEADGWDELKLLITRAKTDCFQLGVAPGSRSTDYNRKEKYFLFQAYSGLSVIIIYKAEMVISRNGYQEQDVESLEELIEEGIDRLNDNEEKPLVPIRFFRANGNFIELKQLHHFHVYDTIAKAIFGISM